MRVIACTEGLAAAGVRASSLRPDAPQQRVRAAPRQLKAARRVACRVADTDIATNGASSSSLNGSQGLDFEELTDLIRMVHDTDIVELELKSKKFSLAVRKREALETPEPVIQHAAPAAPVVAAAPAPAPAPAPVAAAPAPVAAAPAPAPAPAPSPAAVEGVEVTSPMSGTWYSTPAPGEPAFISEGDSVVKGQTIGIVEAMKLMNEIEAELSGTIVKLLVQNGQTVSPGQPVAIIKPQ